MDDDLDQDVFTVEAILGHKYEGSTIKYLIRWEGYSEQDDTYEPTECISLALVAAYEAARASSSVIEHANGKVCKRSVLVACCKSGYRH
jgi:hypothetical protein